MSRLCFVEDDPTIRELVAKQLERKGFEVETFINADPVFSRPIEDFDLYILDILLGGERSGLTLCENLRERSPTIPILILSALSEPSDRVEGLKTGADDYLAKPFEMEELYLRINGMLKRRSWYAALPGNETSYTWKDCAVDFHRFEGRRGNRKFNLSQKECMILKLLIERVGQVVSRDEILDRVWGYDTFPSSRTIDNFIVKLRKQFEPSSAEPIFIHSVRGMGYKFTPIGEKA